MQIVHLLAQGHWIPWSFCGSCAEDCSQQEMQSALPLQRSKGGDDKIGHDWCQPLPSLLITYFPKFQPRASRAAVVCLRTETTKSVATAWFFKTELYSLNTQLCFLLIATAIFNWVVRYQLATTGLTFLVCFKKVCVEFLSKSAHVFACFPPFDWDCVGVRLCM